MGADSISFVVIISLILSLTVFSNILVLVVMMKIPRILNPTNIFICNLTVSDIILSGVVIPQNIHDISHAKQSYHEGDFSCRLVHFSPLLCIMASIYSLVAMSFERKRAIVIAHEQKTTMTQAFGVISVIWCLALAFCVPTIYEYSVYKESTGNGTFVVGCGTTTVSRTYSICNGIGLLLLAYIIPLTTLLINYSSILLYFRSRGLFGGGARNEPLTNQALVKGRMNVIKMLIFVTVLFAISWLPYFILLIIEKATGNTDIEQSNGAVNKLKISLSVFSTSYNFVLNILYNRNFREGFKALFTCQKVIMKNNAVLPADAVYSVFDLPTLKNPGRTSALATHFQVKQDTSNRSFQTQERISQTTSPST